MRWSLVALSFCCVCLMPLAASQAGGMSGVPVDEYRSSFPDLRAHTYPQGAILFHPDHGQPVHLPPCSLFTQKQLDSLQIPPFDEALLLTKLHAANTRQYYLVFSSGPSDDPALFLVSRDGRHHALEQYSITDIVIPANGFVYSISRSNHTFAQRRKFAIRADSVTEIKQPFYYVGLESKTIVPLQLFATPALRQPVAGLPAHSPVTVVLAHFDDDEWLPHAYLVKTPFGLLGWTQLEASQGQVEIEGFYYLGD